MAPRNPAGTIAATILSLVVLACDPPTGQAAPAVPEPPTAAGPGPDTSSSHHPTHASMREVRFHLEKEIILEIDWLEGELRAAADSPVVFDEPRSFTLRIDSGIVALSMTSLGRLMNDWVFAYDDAPLEDLEFSVHEGRLRLNGKLDKLIDIPFEIDATPEMTADGQIRIHPERISTAGAIGNAVRNLFNIDLEDAVDLSGAPAVRADGNDLILDPDRLLPPPRIEGRITSIAVRNERLVQEFGSPAESSHAGEDHYMHFVGGILGFGKLRMIDADLRVVDMDPDDPFDFGLGNYKEQLIAGLSRTTPQLGLEVYMPDLADLRRNTPAKGTARKEKDAAR